MGRGTMRQVHNRGRGHDGTGTQRDGKRRAWRYNGIEAHGADPSLCQARYYSVCPCWVLLSYVALRSVAWPCVVLCKSTKLLSI